MDDQRPSLFIKANTQEHARRVAQDQGIEIEFGSRDATDIDLARPDMIRVYFESGAEKECFKPAFLAWMAQQ